MLDGALCGVVHLPVKDSLAPDELSMDRLVFSGYYGFDNAGDEAILEATIEGLKRHLPHAQLVVLSADPTVTTKRYGVEAVDRGSLRAVWREVRRATLLVSGGGSLIQDVTSRASPFYYLGVLQLARWARTPYVVYNQGIGPLRGNCAAAWTARLFRGAALVTVRDGQSADWLKERGARAAEVLPDCALALPQPDPDRAEQALAAEGLSSDGRRLGFVLRPWAGVEELIARLGAVARRAYRELGLGSVIFPFQPGADRPLAERLAEAIGASARVVAGSYRPSELAALTGACDVVVSMRLHGLVFAVSHARPVVGLTYDPKIEVFLEAIAAGPGCPLTASEEELWQALEAARNRGCTQDLAGLAAKLRKQAERNFEVLAGLAGQGGC